MNKKQSHSPKKLTSDWQVLGELHLAAGESPCSQVKSWLMESLIPLHLPVNFVNKLFDSTHEVLEHAMQSSEERLFDAIHLSLLTPRDQAVDGRTWGFFHIEKVLVQAPILAVEVYLYPEVDERKNRQIWPVDS